MKISFTDLLSGTNEEKYWSRSMGGVDTNGSTAKLVLLMTQMIFLPTADLEMKQSRSFASLLLVQSHAHAGQFGMMNLYSSLFNRFELKASQLLLTQLDFSNSNRLLNLRYAIDHLLKIRIIIKENNTVSGNFGYLNRNNKFSNIHPDFSSRGVTSVNIHK